MDTRLLPFVRSSHRVRREGCGSSPPPASCASTPLTQTTPSRTEPGPSRRPLEKDFLAVQRIQPYSVRRMEMVVGPGRRRLDLRYIDELASSSPTPLTSLPTPSSLCRRMSSGQRGRKRAPRRDEGCDAFGNHLQHLHHKYRKCQENSGTLYAQEVPSSPPALLPSEEASFSFHGFTPSKPHTMPCILPPAQGHPSPSHHLLLPHSSFSVTPFITTFTQPQTEGSGFRIPGLEEGWLEREAHTYFQRQGLPCSTGEELVMENESGGRRSGLRIISLEEHYEGVPFLVEEGSGPGVCLDAGGSGGGGEMVSGEQGGVGGSPGTPTDQPITGPGFAEIPLLLSRPPHTSAAAPSLSQTPPLSQPGLGEWGGTEPSDFNPETFSIRRLFPREE